MKRILRITLVSFLCLALLTQHPVVRSSASDQNSILNLYDAEGRMGLHQDKDEGERSLAAGLPVVSISLGDTARFLFGGLKRKDAVESRLLESGDAFVFGGPARLRYHGVSRILPGTAPRELNLEGRFNLTFRQYDL